MNKLEFISLLRKSVIKGRPKIILQGLIQKSIITDMPNKVRFYLFYKRSVTCLHKNSKGKIYFKYPTELNVQLPKEEYLEFYDTYYTNPRLTMIIQEHNKKLTISTLPF